MKQSGSCFKSVTEIDLHSVKEMSVHARKQMGCIKGFVKIKPKRRRRTGRQAVLK